MPLNFRWLNSLSQTFLERDYLVNNQSVESRILEMARTVEKLYPHMAAEVNFKDKFIEGMEKGWYSLSTPIWCNFGNKRGLPISCNGSYIEDSMESIAYTWSEIAIMTKHGAGTSAYFGDIRGRGMPIRDNGYSSGAVHFVQPFDMLVNTVSQGKARRGNFAPYLPIDHPDIEEFLTIKTEGSKIQDVFPGVCVGDKWMDQMLAGDHDKQETWAKIIGLRKMIGLPYIFFTDTVNNHTVDVYRDKNLKIKASNLCVTGDQRVVSDRGMKTAKELYEEGGSLTLFDNDKPVKASPMQLIEKDADVYKLTLENGMTHTITGYHKVKIRTNRWDGLTNSYEIDSVACLDLEPGDLVAIQTNKGLFGIDDNKDKASYVSQTSRQDVPCWLWSSNEETQWEYIKGLYYAKGEIEISKGLSKSFSISLASNNVNHLREIQLVLANLGVQSNIRKNTVKEVVAALLQSPLVKELAPLFNADELKSACDRDSFCDYYLVINEITDISYFDCYTRFLKHKEIEALPVFHSYSKRKFSAVKSIEYVGKQDVYCCTVESDEHHWVCNGIVTHNCTEIALPSNENWSFVCDLASMNDLYFDEWANTDAVKILTILLDAVMEEYIQKASKIKFMERAVRFAIDNRALGIGQFGYHSLLQSKMIPFESMEAKILNQKISKTIQEQAWQASKELAYDLGEPPLLEGYGRRNTTLTAIAPTTSSAFIIGQASQSIEPLMSNFYIKDLAKIKVSIKNPYLEKLLREKGKDDSATWGSISLHAGSVQHLDFLSDHEKAVFKTFGEISQKEIVIQASQRQRWLDQSQSLNFMISPDTKAKDTNRLMLDAWELGVKTLYYQHGQNVAQNFARDILQCRNCEG